MSFYCSVLSKTKPSQPPTRTTILNVTYSSGTKYQQEISKKHATTNTTRVCTIENTRLIRVMNSFYWDKMTMKNSTSIYYINASDYSNKTVHPNMLFEENKHR